MNVKFADKQRHIKLHRILKPAVHFYHQDLQIETVKTLTVKITAWRALDQHGASWYDKEKNSATIEVNAKTSEVMMLVSLAHEMIHVKQFSIGDLDFDKNNKWLWKNTMYEDAEDGTTEYYDLPWEKEAWEGQTTLALKYLNLSVTNMGWPADDNL